MSQLKVIEWLLVALLVLMIGLFALLVFPQVLTPQPSQTIERVTTIIPVLHQYNNGVHTYVGNVETPTPCFDVTGEALVAESFPEQVTIRLEAKDTGAVCAQVITTKKFKVSFHASGEAYIKSFLNGSPVLFKVTEILPTADIDKVKI